ncbi:MAG: cytochrome c oxidase subunit iii [Phenylobacterium sp.]|nr:cytochrome c oxidase subunit iii [Phenylobacterium sp.]
MSDAWVTSGEAARRRALDPHRVGHTERPSRESVGVGTGGPASKRIITGYGFWLFLLSDIVMFSAFFAAFAVLRGSTAGGPTGQHVFDIPRVAAETGFLLVSSFTCGLSALATAARKRWLTELALLITGLLGAAFLFLEVQEFAGLVAEGAGPQRSAFLSAFFAVVGCHGLHVTAGLLWLGTMMAQIYVKGFTPAIRRRMLCFNLFWHALDIIWVALFTVVYLLGAVP